MKGVKTIWEKGGRTFTIFCSSRAVPHDSELITCSRAVEIIVNRMEGSTVARYNKDITIRPEKCFGSQ